MLLIGILFSLSTQSAYSQRLLKTLRQKAEKKIEQKIEEKAEEEMDKQIDKGFDKLDEALESEEDADAAEGNDMMNSRLQSLLKSAGVGGEPVPYENSYSFDYLIQMHLESYDKNGKETSNGEFITHLSPNSKSMAYQVVSGDMAKEGQGLFILDAENGAMIILNEENGEKQGMVYGMQSFFESMGATAEEEIDLSDTPETWAANPNVKKTGKTKKIAGLKCEEYLYNDENSESEIWITKDLKFDTGDFFSTLFKTSMASQGMGWGYMMEATTIDKESGEKSIMKVTRVDKNSNQDFDLMGYQITNLGNISIPTGNE
jgi:hypothetical protein